MPRVMDPETSMAKAIDAPSVQGQGEEDEATMDDLLAQVDICSGMPDDTAIQVTLGQLRQLLSVRALSPEHRLEKLELLHKAYGEDSPVDLKVEMEKVRMEIDESARAEVEASLYADGIIEDPGLDGGLLG